MADFYKEFLSKNFQKHMYYNRLDTVAHTWNPMTLGGQEIGTNAILPSPSSWEKWPWKGFGTSLNRNKRRGATRSPL
uniref:Cytochrome c oxidase assembly factor 8 n=1 Tax=Pan paniscus TaxID=9597 RepID=A0A2R8ZJH4_PANPA